MVKVYPGHARARGLCSPKTGGCVAATGPQGAKGIRSAPTAKAGHEFLYLIGATLGTPYLLYVPVGHYKLFKGPLAVIAYEFIYWHCLSSWENWDLSFLEIEINIKVFYVKEYMVKK